MPAEGRRRTAAAPAVTAAGAAGAEPESAAR